MRHTAMCVYATISDSCVTLRWRSTGSGFKTEENSSDAALRADTGVGATLAQLKEGQSLNIYTEQMTTEVSYWGSARKSTIKTTSTFSHADIYSFCLHFLFLKPTPSHTQWFLIQAGLQTDTIRNNSSKKTYHDAQIHLGEGSDTHPPSLCGQPPQCPNTEHTTLMTNHIIR